MFLLETQKPAMKRTVLPLKPPGKKFSLLFSWIPVFVVKIWQSFTKICIALISPFLLMWPSLSSLLSLSKCKSYLIK